MTQTQTKKRNPILAFLVTFWKEILSFTIGLLFNWGLCLPKQSFSLKGVAKDDNYKILANSKVEIPGIGTYYTNASGEFIIPEFKTKIPTLAWWPGCNCTTEEVSLNVFVTDTAENTQYCKKEMINFSEQKEDTINKTFYLIKNEN